MRIVQTLFSSLIDARRLLVASALAGSMIAAFTAHAQAARDYISIVG